MTQLQNRRYQSLSRRAVLIGAVSASPSIIAACAQGASAPADNPKPFDASRAANVELLLRANSTEGQDWTQLVARFKALYPAVNVSIGDGPAAAADYMTRILALTAAGSAPDLMVISDASFSAPAHQGVFLDVDGHAKRDQRLMKLDEFWAGTLEAVRWDREKKAPGKGKLYGVPLSTSTELFMYNKRVFREAGVPEPPADGNWTWADFLDRAKKLTKRDGNEVTRVAFPRFSMARMVPWFASHGATDFVDPEKRIGSASNAASAEVVRMAVDYFIRDRITPSLAELKASPFVGTGPVFQNTDRSHIARGVYAMVFAEAQIPWYRSDFKDNPADWDMTLLPRGPKGNWAKLGADPFVASVGSKNADPAWELMKYATSAEGQAILIPTRMKYSVRKPLAEKTFPDPSMPQHLDRWLQSMKQAKQGAFTDVRPLHIEVYTHYWNQMTDENVRRPVNESLKLMDEANTYAFQNGSLPEGWQKR